MTETQKDLDTSKAALLKRPPEKNKNIIWAKSYTTPDKEIEKVCFFDFKIKGKRTQRQAIQE